MRTPVVSYYFVFDVLEFVNYWKLVLFNLS